STNLIILERDAGGATTGPKYHARPIVKGSYGRYSQNSVLSQRTARRVMSSAIILLPQRILPTPVIPDFSRPLSLSNSLLTSTLRSSPLSTATGEMLATLPSKYSF